HRAVVTPAIEARALRAGALDERRLALRDLARGIAGEAARVTQRGLHRPARHAVADGEVARLVHRDAAHPAVRAVARGGRVLLEDRGRRPRRTELVPAHAGRPVRAGVDGVVENERLVIAEVAVPEAVHQAVGERRELLGAALLRDAVARLVVARGLEVRDR